MFKRLWEWYRKPFRDMRALKQNSGELRAAYADAVGHYLEYKRLRDTPVELADPDAPLQLAILALQAEAELELFRAARARHLELFTSFHGEG